MAVKVLEIHLPEYGIENEIEYDAMGKAIDNLVAENLEDGTYVERSIGLIDHPNKTIDELADLILKHGTDKYEAERESIFDQEFSCYAFDIHGSEFTLNNGNLLFASEHGQETYYGQNMYCFKELATLDRGYSIRIGLSMIYEKAGLLPPLKKRECEEQIQKYSNYLYRFKNDEPLHALRAVVKIR